jgi:hypothetical protein
MPYKDRQEYLEYQKAYYRKRKRSSLRASSACSPNPKSFPGLTGQRVLSPARSPAFEKCRKSIPQNQRVTTTRASSAAYASIPSIPVNPAQANPQSSGGTISEATRRHVEKLRKEGWEIDDVGNARRRA